MKYKLAKCYYCEKLKLISTEREVIYWVPVCNKCAEKGKQFDKKRSKNNEKR